MHNLKPFIVLCKFTIVFIFLFSSNSTLNESFNAQNQLSLKKPSCIGQKQHTTKQQNEPIHIVGLGDSLTAGIGDEKKDGGYIGSLERIFTNKDCPTFVNNLSLKGLKSKELLNILDDANVKATLEKADIITFTIGANDLLSAIKNSKMLTDSAMLNKTERNYAQNIEKILAKIRSLNGEAHIYFIGLYNPLAQIFPDVDHLDLLVTKWNNISENNTKKMSKTHFVPIDKEFAEQLHLYLAEDNFHPNHLGYEVIAKRLLSIMMNEGD